MNKTISIFFSVLLVSGFGAPSQAFAQGPVLVDKFGDWEISQSNTIEGAFEVCLATKSYENDEAVIFYANGTSLVIGLLLQRWQLDASGSYDIALQFEDGLRHPGQAISGEDNKSVLINLDFSGNLGEIKSSENLYLHTAAGSLRFDITGAGAALDQTLDCASKNQLSPAE